MFTVFFVWLGLSALTSILVVASCIVAGKADQHMSREITPTPIERQAAHRQRYARQITSQWPSATYSYLALPVRSGKPYQRPVRRSYSG